MSKEVWVAIIIGFLLGIAITFGVYTANQALLARKTPSPSPTILKPEETPVPTTNFSISYPADEVVIDKPEITITGQAPKGSIIVILGEKSEEFAQADSQGIFTTNIDLIKGLNRIKVIALVSDEEKIEKTITLVYSTYKFK